MALKYSNKYMPVHHACNIDGRSDHLVVDWRMHLLATCTVVPNLYTTTIVFREHHRTFQRPV